MRFVEYFDNQDTAFEFDRVLRNMARYHVIRQRITGASRKRRASSAFAVSYEIGLRASSKYDITLVHEGNGVVDVKLRSLKDGFVFIETRSETDSFLFEGETLRLAIAKMAARVNRYRQRAVFRPADWKLLSYNFFDLNKATLKDS